MHAYQSPLSQKTLFIFLIFFKKYPLFFFPLNLTCFQISSHPHHLYVCKFLFYNLMGIIGQRGLNLLSYFQTPSEQGPTGPREKLTLAAVTGKLYIFSDLKCFLLLLMWGSSILTT